MTIRQQILKILYPYIMWAGRMAGNKQIALNPNQTGASTSFHRLTATDNNSESFNFDNLRGKMVLIVNTASDCGYTRQLAELEELYRSRKDTLQVIAFPSNEFKGQERGSDKDIAAFCSLKYGTTFPIMKKSIVLKKNDQNDIYRWLTDDSSNGWNNRAPAWNFCKYLVDGNGRLLGYFGSSVSPMDKVITDLIDGKTKV